MGAQDAITIVGAWQAALATSAPGNWSSICASAAARACTADSRSAWTALAGLDRDTVAGRLHAAGIYP